MDKWGVTVSLLKLMPWKLLAGPLLIFISWGIATYYSKSGSYTPPLKMLALSLQNLPMKAGYGAAAKDDAITLEWGLLQGLNYHTGKVTTEELQKVVDKQIRIPGFAVPLGNDFKRIKEFLLVPNALACIHVPPPPANLMVYVKMGEPMNIESLSGPLWLSGVLKLKSVPSVYGSTGWELIGAAVSPYEF